MDNPRLDYLRDKVKKLPLQPGIYIMKDKKGQINHYIGKAKALKNRVSSYFLQCGQTYTQGLPHGRECLGF